MKRVILHIGRHKTGTTNVQLFLCSAQDELARLGAIYPQTGREPLAHDSRATIAHHAMALLARYPDASKIEAMRADLLQETEPFDTIILSSEAFQNLSDLTALSNLLAGFHVTLVCYLREFLAYCASAYAQDVQTSALPAPFAAFAEHAAGRLSPWHFFEAWSAYADVSRWRLYDRASLEGGDIVSDFLASAGLALKPAETTDSNPSISGNLLGFKLLVNLAGLHGPNHPMCLACWRANISALAARSILQSPNKPRSVYQIHGTRCWARSSAKCR